MTTKLITRPDPNLSFEPVREDDAAGAEEALCVLAEVVEVMRRGRRDPGAGLPVIA
jgi:hypothetical protein